MSRNLASVQRVISVEDCPNSDNLSIIKVLGWQIVGKRGEFTEGSLCVYFEIDAILKEGNPEFEFMRPRKFRVKTIKLRGALSQGLCFPLSILPKNKTYKEGQDVTEVLGVTKYEPPEVQLGGGGIKHGHTKRGFPKYVAKTDETRVQSRPGILGELDGVPCFISVKLDGTSLTAGIKDGEIDVCSRNLSIKDPNAITLWDRICIFLFPRKKYKHEVPKNTYWDMVEKYNIRSILKKYDNIVIQGEIAGPGIQGNKLGLSDVQLFVFNVFSVNEQRYYDYEDFINFCKENNLQTVPIESENVDLSGVTMEKLLEMAEGKYPNGSPREGIVIRAMKEKYCHTLSGRFSFKVISNSFLLKYGKE